jgi:hypothetical protein
MPKNFWRKTAPNHCFDPCLAMPIFLIEVIMFVKNSRATLALLFALSVAITQSLWASTVTVMPSEVQTRIQASINNSHVGDVISFQASTYNLSQLRLQPGAESVPNSSQHQLLVKADWPEPE